MLPRVEADNGVGPPPAHAYLQVQISEPGVIRGGENKVSLVATPLDPSRKIEVMDVQLAVLAQPGRSSD